MRRVLSAFAKIKLANALKRVATENVYYEWTDNDWKFHVNLIPPPQTKRPGLSAQQITIFLGSEAAAFHPNWTGQNDITHVLTALPEVCIPQIAPLPRSGTRKIVPLIDISSTPIQDHFSNVFEWMTHLPVESRLLVHCQAGISRSTTLLASYFIRLYRLSYEETIQHMRQFRSQCHPNNGFAYQLRRLAEFCKQIDLLPLNPQLSELILDYV